MDRSIMVKRDALIAQLGIGIEADAAGIGIPASSFSVRYRSIPTGLGNPYSGTGQSGIPAFDKFAQRYEHCK
jgi:hypothetical protein